MRKNVKVLFVILIFCSCNSKTIYRDFVSLLDVIEYGNRVHKPSLLCILDAEEKAHIMEKYDSLADNFVCYIVNDPLKNVLGKMVQPSEYPVYIIFQKDSIVSLLHHSEFEVLLGKTNMGQLQNNLLNTKHADKDIDYLNVLLKLHEYLGNQAGKFAIELSYLDSLVEKQNKFYGKYLLAQLYKNIDAEKASEIYNSLWINSTADEMKLYPEEFIDIMKKKDHLISVSDEDVVFDYTEYDFGTIAPYEEAMCRFYFTNNSDKKFVIHNVITTCGCTVPSWNRQPINPNIRDSITVKFKTDHAGINQKTIIVEGNCKRKIKLNIKALVS